MNHHRKLGRWLLVLLWAAAVVGIVPASGPAHAQGLAPSIKVAPVWHPALQLTSLDAGAAGIWNPGDDIRYIEADIMVTTTVEFWATEITCTVDKTILDGYTNIDSGPDGWHDDQPMVIWGDIWSWGSGFAEYVIPFELATGKMTFVASKVAMSSPIGRNGESVSEKLAVLRYRVKPQTGTFNKTVALTCTSSFLDRNGKPVVVPTYQAPPPARITSGYNIQGTASYQARAAKAGIGVDCESYGTGLHYTTTTNLAGAFALNNIRDMGHFNCRIFSNLTNPAAGAQPDLYLSGWADFNMGERGSMNILPVQLRGGDLGSHDDNIDWNDINLITTNWMLNANGDVNGDLKTDKADLAIVAGNLDWNNWMSAWHVLYGLPRVNTPSYNSRIWLGDYRSGAVTQFVANAGASQFYWPMLSPDGSKIVYSRSDGNTDVRKRKFELYVGDNITKLQKPLVTRAMTGSYNAFAPSWSPDGTRIAFVQGYTYFNSDTSWYSEVLWNQGSLAIVDADGRNYRSLSSSTSIFPPTWLDNNTILFACGGWGGSWNICYYNLWDDTVSTLDSDIPSDSDMPIIMNGNLYYRWTDTSSGIPPYPSHLRFAELDWSTWPVDVAAFTPHPGSYQAKPPFVHTDVVYYNGVSYGLVGENELDYYDVAWYGNQITFNGFYDNGFRNTFFDWEVFNNDLGACGDPGTVDYCYPQWWLAEWHEVDSQVWNPWWTDRDVNYSTWLHALRNTIDWVP
jgi:hypothetical protein